MQNFHKNAKSMEKLLVNRLKGKVIVLGIGNTLRGDDGFGSILARRLKGKVKATVISAEASPENFLGQIIKEGPDNILIVDAVDFGARPGSMRLFDPQDLRAANLCFTHNTSLGLIAEFIKKGLSADVFILGVQPDSVGFGRTLSRAVKSALREIEKALLGYLAFLFVAFICLGCQRPDSTFKSTGTDSEGLSQSVRVSRVIDGDTIELVGGRHVRYIGIDTPEVRYKRHGQWVFDPAPFALQAKELNRRLVEGKQVRLEFDVEKKDKYGRLLAYVFVGDTFVNAELLRAGLAQLFTLPPNVKYVDLFVELQEEARANNRGLWSR
jgi:micrococcal nuclease